MRHFHAADFAAVTPVPAPTFPPLRPWEYLHLRRQAAGKSIDDVATALSPRIARRSDAAAFIRLLEQPGMTALHDRPLQMLASVFPLDVTVYRQLAASPADQHPPICRGCGASAWDPARGGVLGSLSWDEPGKMCTGCADDRAMAA